jgi:hypothetical protein
MAKDSKFLEAFQIDVREHTKKKNGLSYLSWAHAWAEFKKIYPEGIYQIVKNEAGTVLFGDDKTGFMVYTNVTVGEITHEMWLPVLNFSNKSMLKPTTFDINKSVMRCLTKNLAMFGIGLYIYAGEDLPEVVEVDEEVSITLPSRMKIKKKLVLEPTVVTSKKVVEKIKKKVEKESVKPVDKMQKIPYNLQCQLEAEIKRSGSKRENIKKFLKLEHLNDMTIKQHEAIMSVLVKKPDALITGFEAIKAKISCATTLQGCMDLNGEAEVLVDLEQMDCLKKLIEKRITELS